MFNSIFDVIGMVGVAFILLGYYGVQSNRIRYNDMLYPILNIIGSSMILASLYVTPNLPSIIIEVAWLVIGAYGIRVAHTSKKEEQKNND